MILILMCDVYCVMLVVGVLMNWVVLLVVCFDYYVFLVDVVV